MTAELQGIHADPGVFPFPLPADAFGTSDGMRINFPGLQEFGRRWTEAAIQFRLLPAMPTRERWHLLTSATSTGPSEVSIFPEALDATGDSGDGMGALELAAEAGDERAFIQAARQIDWLERSAADFGRAVHLALKAGAHLLARNLAAEGARLHPEHPELQKMDRILAPPRIVRTHVPPDPSVRANAEWLRTHAAAYRGQWVALKNGMLVASAPTARELKERLPGVQGILLTRVA